eukprot:g81596.t1
MGAICSTSTCFLEGSERFEIYAGTCGTEEELHQRGLVFDLVEAASNLHEPEPKYGWQRGSAGVFSCFRLSTCGRLRSTVFPKTKRSTCKGSTRACSSSRSWSCYCDCWRAED